MNSEWKQFLTSQGARIEAEEAVRFDSTDTPAACQLVDLSHLALISVTGGDSETFLQGQVTSDIRDVNPSHFQISALCTPKGRMQASFIVFHQEGGYLLQLPPLTQQALLKRLPMFVLMSDVKINDASDEWVRFGLMGEGAELLLGELFEELPRSPWMATASKQIKLLRHPGNTPRIELVGPAMAMIGVWKQLALKASAVDADYWSLERIRAGVPTVYGETSEAFLPQMANLQLIDGVSFTKGCYTGQEIVARTKYLGKIKRRMYLATIDQGLPPRPGDELYAEAGENERAAGKVVDAAPSPQGGYELLAVVEIARQEQGGIHLGSIDGPQLQFSSLPYPFEKE